jgi:hypothetical protein
MNRREFVRSAGALSASLALSRMDAESGTSDGWRTFEVKTQVEILKAAGAARVWLPVALPGKTPFQQTLSNVGCEQEFARHVGFVGV